MYSIDYFLSICSNRSSGLFFPEQFVFPVDAQPEALMCPMQHAGRMIKLHKVGWDWICRRQGQDAANYCRLTSPQRRIALDPDDFSLLKSHNGAPFRHH
jgi:hypothetical protein